MILGESFGDFGEKAQVLEKFISEALRLIFNELTEYSGNWRGMAQKS